MAVIKGAETIAGELLGRLPFAPTPSQRLAVAEMARLLTSTAREPVMVMHGFAGTGKTTILRALCDEAEELGFGLCLMAPTGRAAKVMQNATGRPAQTIHKTIYRQDSYDFLSPFSLGYNNRRFTLYVVDEASMISDMPAEPMPGFRNEDDVSAEMRYASQIFGSGRLLTDLIAFVFSHAGGHLLFCGDSAQLPPVGTLLAPALNTPLLRRFGMCANEVRLTEVVRQSEGSPILENARRLRALIDAQGGTPKLVAVEATGQPRDPGLPAVVRLAGDELIEALISAHDNYGAENTLVITRSNKRASAYNQGIRAQVMGREDALTRGDLVMVTKNSYLWRKSLIANGDIARIERIGRFSEMYGRRFADVTLRFIDEGSGVEEGTDTDKCDSPELEARLNMECLTSGDASLSPERMAMLRQAVEEDYADIGDRRKRYRAMREDKWLGALLVKFAYAVTCHKAQGGQWDAVFVDPAPMPPGLQETESLRWLYTAATRATKRLYLVNFPNDWFE